MRMGNASNESPIRYPQAGPDRQQDHPICLHQQEPNIARNRRYKILRIAFGSGMQRFGSLERNPVVGLRLMTEKPRDRFVTDDEYTFIYDLASPALRLMMEGAYLLRAAELNFQSSSGFTM